MSYTEKLGPKVAELVQEQVLATAMVVPPGATLYKMYAPKSAAIALGGPIFAAFAAKMDGGPQGLAGQVPRQQGFLAVTPTRVLYLSKKAVGTAPKEVVTGWLRDAITLHYTSGEKWTYPGLALAFSDGSSCVVFGEKKWGLDEVGAVG